MRKFAPFFLASIASVTLLLGCGTNPSKQDIGAVLGGVVGGVVGNQFGGKTLLTIAGAIAGAYAGSSVGRSLDDQDRRNAEITLNTGLERQSYGHASQGSWNKGSRRYESNVYTSQPRGASQSNCKEYRQDMIVTIGTRPEKATTSGIACKNPRTGEWEIMPN